MWAIAAPFLFILALGVSAFGLWQLRRDSERRAVWYLIVGASVLYVAVFRLPFLRPYPYGFLKSLTLVSFVLIAAVVQGVEYVANWIAGLGLKSGRLTRVTAIAVSCLFVALVVFTFGISLEQYFKPASPFFDADDLELRAAGKLLPREASILLTDRAQAQGIPMGLAAYALLGNELHGNVTTGYAQMNNAGDGEVYRLRAAGAQVKTRPCAAMDRVRCGRMKSSRYTRARRA